MSSTWQVILVRLGNCRTSEAAALLRNRYADLTIFYQDDAAALLELS